MVAACSDSFEPISPGEVQFSVFGYLDASADTRWIMVMPIRPLLLTAPDSFGIRVSVEEVGTGRVIELRDSVLAFGTLLEGGEAFVHEYWITERIAPGGRYRFAARNESGAIAESVVEVPGDYRPFTGRMPAMHRLGLALERGFDLEVGRLQLQAGVINAYDRPNLFYYDLFTGRRVDQLPLAPYASVTLRSR